MSEWTYTKITGLDELQIKLDHMPEKVAKRCLRSGLMAGARIVVSAFVAFAPRLTGFLAEHFDIRLSVRGGDIAASAYIGPQGKVDYPLKGGGYRVKTNAKGKSKNVGRVKVASVARWLEFGTAKMAAKPFMTPAWESHKEVVLEAITTELRDGIEEAAKE